ncbi:MAG: glycoside hydrolase family 3 N-terminal domain-containing protein [Dehalococcoidales bacterium]|jgi:beta-glucosidase
MKKTGDSAAAIKTKVKALLARMTLEEKIAQLGSVFATPLLENGKFSPAKAKEVLKNGIGHISAPAMSSGLPLREVTALNNAIQQFLRENTRLGIPAIVHEECLNGFRAYGTTIFPQNIGLASTWEPDLINRITTTIRRQMRAAGIHQGLAPVLDVTRDPRWGRVEETFGEDPFLVSRMGVAYIKGLQGDDITRGIVATTKHFAGHGLPEGGLNCAPSHIPPRLLREVYLYPFEKAVKEAGVLSVMNAYHEIDGIPCGASEELLTDILRGEWGFEGAVVSDYFAIAQLETTHRIAGNKSDAAALALRAGIDIELPATDCYGEPLLKAVKDGTVTLALVDRAVTRVLSLKFRLGLFENTYADPAGIVKATDTAADRKLALEAARKSIVLLKNEGNLLPLKKNLRSIAVIGPSAASQRNLLGDYTFPAHSRYELKTDKKTGAVEMVLKNKNKDKDKVDAPQVVTILDGIKAAVGKNTKVLYARGCEIQQESRKGFAEAVKAAQSADVTVVVVGDLSGLTPENTSGEMRDRSILGLPGVQEELVKAVYATGTPVVLVLANGRPYTLKWLAEKIPAIVCAWEPGEEGGRAVADVLFGNYNPGGRLPVSFPRNEGQIPVYYYRKPSGRKNAPWQDYVDGSADPLYEFGYGLSYTTFEFSDLKITPVRITAKGAVTVKADAKNTGKKGGDVVVQLYVNDVLASVTRPVKELKAFERLYLEAGEQKTVTFRLPADCLAFYNKKMERKVEPGVFKVMLGNSSADIRLEGEFEVRK